MGAHPQPRLRGAPAPRPPAPAAPPSTLDAAPDLARLAELYDRSLLLDRCARALSQSAAGAVRLARMRQRLLLSMRAAGLPESRWFRVGRFGLYLEARPDPAPSPPGHAYRLYTAPWAAVRFAPAGEAPAATLSRTRGASPVFAAYLSFSLRWLARVCGGRGS